MAGNILTPSSLWGGFTVPEKLGVESVGEKVEWDVVYNELNIEGRKTADGTVEIYGVFAHAKQLAMSSPAVLVLNDLDKGVDYSRTSYARLRRFSR